EKRPGTVQLPIPEHGSAGGKHHALMLFYRSTGPRVGVFPRDALRQNACISGGRKQIAGAFGPHPIVAFSERAELRGGVPEIRELVDEDVGRCSFDRRGETVRIEHIANDWHSPELSQPVDLVCGTSHAGDVMTGTNEKRHEPAPEDTGSAGNEDAHLDVVIP